MRGFLNLVIGLLDLAVSIVFFGLAYSSVLRIQPAITTYAQEPEDVWGLFLISVFAGYIAVTSLFLAGIILRAKLVSTIPQRLTIGSTFLAVVLLLLLAVFGFSSSTPADKELRLLLFPAFALIISYYYIKPVGDK